MRKVPVLFVFFNRPDTALQSFASIRRYRPDRLYLASDGPRQHVEGESAVVKGLRDKILSMVDWECDVRTNFQENNNGCGKNVYNSISWLFSNEERGIVIEDDVVAGDSFFPFMEEMLEKYADDRRVGLIVGLNPFESFKPAYSYVFSRYMYCWDGWASWRDRWANMDFAMDWRKSSLKESIIRNRGGKDLFQWRWQISYIDHGYVSSWDWQWYFSLSSQNQLCIFPAVNLAMNIGNDANATHNSKAKDITFQARTMEFPLKYSPYVVPDAVFEDLMYRRVSNLRLRMNRRIPRRIKDIKNNILKRLKGLF
jgi:hypothetical protein